MRRSYQNGTKFLKKRGIFFFLPEKEKYTTVKHEPKWYEGFLRQRVTSLLIRVGVLLSSVLYKKG